MCSLLKDKGNPISGHQVRDDSGAREGKDKDYFKEAPDWADRTTESGTFSQKINNMCSNHKEVFGLLIFYAILKSMNKVVFVRYVDASYFEEKKLPNDKFIIHHAVGKIIASPKESVMLCFTKRNGIPWSCLLLPCGALILDKKNEVIEVARIKGKINKLEKNTSVGVFWKDIVYFQNGVIPQAPSLMYTEGKVFSVTRDAVIIKDPETMNITPGKLTDHPRELTRISFMLIPRKLITDIEVYDK